jgi:hypothetical protein
LRIEFLRFFRSYAEIALATSGVDNPDFSTSSKNKCYCSSPSTSSGQVCREHFLMYFSTSSKNKCYCSSPSTSSKNKCYCSSLSRTTTPAASASKQRGQQCRHSLTHRNVSITLLLLETILTSTPTF